MKKITMKLSTCMWPHWVKGWEEETGTDHQLQHTQWKSLIASHFRLKGEKEEMMRNLECTSLEKWHRWRSGKYTSFFFLFKYTAGGRREERSRRQMFSGRFIKRRLFFGNITSIWVVKKMKCANKKTKKNQQQTTQQQNCQIM